MARGAMETQRYSVVAMAFHWIIAALILVNIFLGLGHAYNEQWGAMPVHKAIGITVLALSVGRLAWRLGHRPPPLPADVTPAQRGVAHGLHWSFYLLMIALPLTGWLFVSASAKYPISWFGLFDVPFLPVMGDKALGGATHQLHSVLGFLFGPLILLHVGAALWHHYGQRDTVLLRMMPGSRRTA